MEGETRKVQITLSPRRAAQGLDLMAEFRAQAKREGWSDADIAAVVTEACSRDYDYFIRTLMAHIAEPSDHTHEQPANTAELPIKGGYNRKLWTAG
jgi:hypothetical protein